MTEAPDIIAHMSLKAILQSIDEEVEILRKVRALLTNDTNPVKSAPAQKRRMFTPEARRNMAASQRARRAREKVVQQNAR